MIDAATLAPLRTLAGRVLALSDVDAACVLLFAQGLWQQEASVKLAITCGEAERLADALESPEAAREYERRLADAFVPFADIVRAILPERGTRYTNMGIEYRRTTVAALAEAEAKRRKKEARRIERHIATYAEVAAELDIPVAVAHNYASKGALVAVRPQGRGKAIGVTRASLDAYKSRQAIRKANATARAEASEAHRAEREAMGGIFYTGDGRKIGGAERITAAQIVAAFQIPEKKVWAAGRNGEIAHVFDDANRKHAVGYLRATVETWVVTRAAAGGVYFTADGEIVGAERVSAKAAAAMLHTNLARLDELTRQGEIAHAYADAERTIPCGYTRKSVEAYAQAHPIHIPAKRAVAAPDFMIETLPPPPRSPQLHAARLDPDAESAEPPAVIERAEARHRRERPQIVFRLALAAAIPPDERKQDMEGQEQQDARNGEKLQVAKAYTVHEAGVIRAICVSEADRDEIVEALRLYRRARAKPGEVESALQLLRAAREIVGTSATAEPEAPDATPAAVTN